MASGVFFRVVLEIRYSSVMKACRVLLLREDYVPRTEGKRCTPSTSTTAQTTIAGLIAPNNHEGLIVTH
jgi:hypothetical protein